MAELRVGVKQVCLWLKIREAIMATIVIYTRATCNYCLRAKELLKQKHQHFNEIKIDEEPQKREEMIQRSGRTTVPQIFINDKHIGGCDDLYALDAAGKLDPLL